MCSSTTPIPRERPWWPGTHYYNLVGRIDFRVRFGVMVTDPRMIKAGALHHANGGYLILDLIDVLSNPLSWDGLKRTLRTNEVRIENLGEQMGIIPTASLRPEPIPVQLKVVLVGPPFLYYLLHALDKDFGRLFKVKVEFDTEMPATSTIWRTRCPSRH